MPHDVSRQDREPAPDLELTLLGAVSMRWYGMDVDLGTPQQRALWAVLVLRSQQVVPVGELVEALWDEARSTLDLPADELDAYTAALEERFRNPRLADNLIRIAADGTSKLPVRALPVIAERGGPAQAPGEVSAVAAWTAWVTDRVRGGHEVADPQAEAIAAAAVLEDDRERVAALVGLLDGATEELAAAVHAEEPRLPRP